MEDDSITLILFGQEVVINKKFEYRKSKQYEIELSVNNLIIFRKINDRLDCGANLNISITELQEIIEAELYRRYGAANNEIAQYTKAKNYIESLGIFKEIQTIKEIIE